MIIEANSQDDLPVILELAMKDPNNEAEEEYVHLWLQKLIGSELFGAWIDFDREPKGLCTVEMVDAPHDPKGFIAYHYTGPGRDQKPLIDRAFEWCKRKDLNIVLYYTSQRPDRYIKRYGFEVVRYILRKAL